VEQSKKEHQKRYQFGTVLVFREGVSLKEAKAALAKIERWLDPKSNIVQKGEGVISFDEEHDYAPYVLREFDAAWSLPVWFLP